MSQTGSPMLVVHSTYVQLPGRESICRRLSGHTALDTSGRDLIFCFVTTELGQDNQLEKQTPCCVAYDRTWLTSGYYGWSPMSPTSSCST